MIWSDLILWSRKMSLIKKITFGLTFGMALCLAAASYADEPQKKEFEKTSDADAILFRIENIKPLTNEEGLTDRCSFLVTVYNRMEKKVEKINMDFRWQDAIAKKYQIVDDSVEPVDDPKDAITYIMKHIELEDIFPHQQKSFEEIVTTDKCFLLLDQLEYKVNDCIAEGDKITVKNNQQTKRGSCLDRFNYINTKIPDYYSEYIDTPDSVLEQQAEEAKAHELAGVEEVYKKSLADLEEVSLELDKIITREAAAEKDKKVEGEDKDKKDESKDEAEAGDKE